VPVSGPVAGLPAARQGKYMLAYESKLTKFLRRLVRMIKVGVWFPKSFFLEVRDARFVD
jgi:hypothetical protein